MSTRKIRQPKWPERKQHIGWCFSLNGSLWKKSRKKANKRMHSINGYMLLQQIYRRTIEVAGDNWKQFSFFQIVSSNQISDSVITVTLRLLCV